MLLKRCNAGTGRCRKRPFYIDGIFRYVRLAVGSRGGFFVGKLSLATERDLVARLACAIAGGMESLRIA
jgi:hypothetical protein